MSVLVGKKAPSFQATAVVNGKEVIRNFSLDEFIGKQHILLFFYPRDFSSVCPTEIIAFQQQLQDFESRNCAVIGCSTDSAETHLAWLNLPQDQGGISGVRYPLVADSSKTVSDAFGVLAGEYDYNEEGNLVAHGPMIAYRGLFLIDKNGIVQHQVVNNFHLGRSTDEALRMLEALQFTEEHGEACPANWKRSVHAC